MWGAVEAEPPPDPLASDASLECGRRLPADDHRSRPRPGSFDTAFWLAFPKSRASRVLPAPLPELSLPPLARNLVNWVKLRQTGGRGALGSTDGGRNLHSPGCTVLGSFSSWAAALAVEALLSSSFLGLLRKVICDGDLVGAGTKAPGKEVVLPPSHLIENVRVKELLEGEDHVPLVLGHTPSCHHPIGSKPRLAWAQAPALCTAPGAGGALGYCGCSVIVVTPGPLRGPSASLGNRCGLGMYISAQGGPGASLPLAGQSSKALGTRRSRFGGRMEESSHLCFSETAPDPVGRTLRKSAKRGFWSPMGHLSSIICFLPRPQRPSSSGRRFCAEGSNQFLLLSAQFLAHSRCLHVCCGEPSDHCYR